MMKILRLAIIFLVSFSVLSCQNKDSDMYAYAELTFPNYTEQNPVRFLEEDLRGVFNGWQDFGPDGEIQTMPVPMATYTYQMYSYYIRNDLQLLYGDIALPENLADFPEWVIDVHGYGQRILWYSMGKEMPEEVELINTETITSDSGLQTFLKAEYQITYDDVVQEWIIYFMDVDGTFCSYGVRANESYEYVEPWTDSIVMTYQER